ncbi:MAG TPA: thiamine pyrophosphate-dependent enzyme [Gemmataceae bacterium]|nr:thiamine pyrophosphate-dependent enzyme [Gemmataceae bacterium]
MDTSEKNPKNPYDRRDFLKIAAGGVGALVAGNAKAQTQNAEAVVAKPADDASVSPASLPPLRPGSDFMIDVIKSLGFEYCTVNPGINFRGLMESAINYGGNKNPQLITVLHEESCVAIPHGYFKIEGKPMGVFIYGTVGMQHAAMAIYSAWCDRVPVVLFVGNGLDMAKRSGRVSMVHSAQDVSEMVRGFIKWDDSVVSLDGFAESVMRGYKIAMTPPYGPVVISVDQFLQEDPIPEGMNLRIPKYSPTLPPQADEAALVEVAKMLLNAEYPVIIAERVARTPAGLKSMVELAELLQAAVVDNIQRMNFPSRHPLRQGNRAIRDADVILSLENPLLWSDMNEMSDDGVPGGSKVKAGVKVVSISSLDLFMHSNYQDFGRYQPVDLSIGADAEETLPALIEAVKRQMTANRRTALQARGAKLAEAHQKAEAQMRAMAAFGWNNSPMSTPRVAAEVWEQIKDKDWSLVSRSDGMASWANRLWNFEKYYHHIGQSGSVGIGYNSPAAVGAALANKKYGRLSINLQNDGDLMYSPQPLWTAAHYQIPMLTIMHNNRAYNTEFMEIQRAAGKQHRDIACARIPASIDNPNVHLAKLAQSMGWYAEGPIEDPKDLAPAIKRALAVVEKGEPAFLDTVTQPT